VLLDTHAWLWLAEGEAQFSPEVLGRIEVAAEARLLRVAPISVWEVAMLDAKGRIRLSQDCHSWVKRALSPPGPALAPMTSDILIDSTRLPGTFHGDPADRMIVATARALDACLMTADDNILRYAKQGAVEVQGL
jgi:PIN domain nuclease of toxin-antitoxin system